MHATFSLQAVPVPLTEFSVARTAAAAMASQRQLPCNWSRSFLGSMVFIHTIRLIENARNLCVKRFLVTIARTANSRLRVRVAAGRGAGLLCERKLERPHTSWLHIQAAADRQPIALPNTRLRLPCWRVAERREPVCASGGKACCRRSHRPGRDRQRRLCVPLQRERRRVRTPSGRCREKNSLAAHDACEKEKE